MHALLLVVLVAVAALTSCGVAADPPTPGTAVTPPGVQSGTAHGQCRVVDGRADTRCTPGVRNRQVTQLNIGSTICRKGWTATVRPPESYTGPLKRRQMAAYGEPSPPSLYEEDHLISLELGGSPTDPANLYPQPYTGVHGARVKDTEENSLNWAVCGGRLTLAEAQAQIVRDWTHG